MARNGTLIRLAVAFAFAGAAMVATTLVYNERDQLVDWSWSKSHGKFDPAPNEPLAAAARDYAEKQHPGQACVSKWLGKDDKYLYLALGCARFEETLGEVKAVEGDSNFLATRMRYSKDTIEGMEQPHPKAYQNGIRRLFPMEAAEKLRNTNSQPEFHSQGLARMEKIRGN